MRALDDQVRAGKILYPAVSDWAAWEIAEACTAARLRDWSPFTAVQLRYNLLDRTPERQLLPMASALDLPVFILHPLAQGRLTGKYLTGPRHPPSPRPARRPCAAPPPVPSDGRIPSATRLAR